MNDVLTIDLGATLDAVRDAGLFSKTVTIEVHDGTLDAAGQPTLHVDADWDPLADHEDLACMLAADEQMGRITQSLELQFPDRTVDVDHLHCLLDGYFPAIEKQMRAVVGSTTFNITGVEHASQNTMTRLALEEYRL